MEQQLEHIIEGCKQNKRQSQELLYKYCFQQMMKVCQRYHNNTDDAAASYNTAMFTVFTKINQYKNQGEFLGWIRRIMVNTCLNALKQNTRFEAAEITDKEYQSFQVKPEVYSAMDSKDILALVQSLPSTCKLVFNLNQIEGFSHEQVAEHLNISIGTSKWYLHEARKILKEKIQNMQQNEIRKNA
jgi:RNA polymerase sigma-70 factor (ECF subfamily)